MATKARPDALSMGAGEFLSSRSYNAYVTKEREREEWVRFFSTSSMSSTTHHLTMLMRDERGERR